MKNGYICFGDFEFTCGDSEFKKSRSELLSVGLVICDRKYRIADNFYCTIKPACNPIMSKRCVDLTKLTQQEINNSPDSNEVMKRVLDLLDKYEVRKIFVWGNFDRLGLRFDADNHRRAHREKQNIVAVGRKIVDVQSDVIEMLGLPEAVNIAELSGVFGFVPKNGTYHNAYNDAMGLYTIHRGAYKTAFYNNEKLNELKQARINRIEEQRQKTIRFRRQKALSITLFDEETSYLSGFPEDKREEARNRLLDNRYLIVNYFSTHPDTEEFVLVASEPPAKPKIVPASDYSDEKYPDSIYSSYFTKNNFAGALVGYLELTEAPDTDAVTL